MLIKKNVDLSNNFFYKKIQKENWFLECNVIASFISIKTEIPTNRLNNFFEQSNKTLCLPVINDCDKEALIFCKYSKGDPLLTGKYGVKEPPISEKLLPDIIIVPCLAFDLKGYRLGYGGGYYDKTISYFKNINHKFITIALAYDFQKVENVIYNNLDQKLNYILTEKQLYKIS